MIGGYAFWFWIRDGIERSGCSTVDKWSEDRNAFYSFLVVGGCHVELCAMLLLLREDGETKPKKSKKWQNLRFVLAAGSRY